ncbi:DNA-binding response regulator (plasmid) [Bacillus thuringiensis]|uniref:DNA-binding response regulator n=1 Tax=Bacillus thuringiensis TaxID=1428 RepID=UPI002225597F|nr:DNA-binding response regulator [Bacillus thuringiensis]UYX55706.1 DNA-binding response regulator [Bacillus thuringiensis]UYX55826.1 DNA-binding response regulator [Bacillus thuringiensis]
MDGIIARSKFVEEIKAALEREAAFIKIGEFEEDSFKQACFSAAQVSLKLLLIDIGVTDSASLITGIKSIRASKPSIRIVLLAIDKEPGDKTVAAVVSMGITDVIPLSTETIDEKGKERENFTPLIEKHIKRNTTYADVVRWHYEVGNEFSTSNEKIKTKILTKKQVIEKKIYETKTEVVSVANKNIAICGLSSKSGSSFVSMNLAMAMSDYDLAISIVEPPINPYFFDTLLLHEHEEEDNQFMSIPHMIKQNEIGNKEFNNKVFDIYWNVADTRKSKIGEWGINELIKQIHFEKKAINIVDFGENVPLDAFSYMDYIFIIIDPQPYLIAKEIDKVMNFVKLKQEGHPIYFIFNKMNKGVDGKGLCNSLGLEGVINIPHIDPIITYNCLYDGRIPFEHKDINEEFVDSMDIIIKEIIGNKYYKKEKKPTLFNRLFKK